MADWGNGQENRRPGTVGDVMLGLVLLLACSALLWWQEGGRMGARDKEGAMPPVRAIAEADSLAPIQADALTYMSGSLKTQALLRDSLTGVSVCAVGIRRQVEFFQWVEVKRAAADDAEGRSAYAYHQRWVSRPVDSSAFHSAEARRRYANMVLADIPAENHYADDVTLRGYRLPPDLVAALPADEPLNVVASAQLRERLNRQAAQAHRSAGRGPLLVSNVVHVQGGVIYIGAGGSPRNGDVRIVLEAIMPEQVSLVAAVSGTDVIPYRAPDGREILRLLPGVHSARDMLADLSAPGQRQARSVWPLRLAAAFGCACAFLLLLRPLARRRAAAGRPVATKLPLWGGSLLLGLLWAAGIVFCAG